MPSDIDKIDLAWRFIDDADQQNDTLRSDIELSDSFYMGRSPPSNAEGRSQAVSMDCMNMCSAVLAQIMSSFSSEVPASFPSQGDDDDIQAELESLAVAAALDESGGYLSLHAAVDSALRYKNGVMRVFVDDVKTTSKRELPGATAEQLAQVLAAIPGENDPVIKGETVSWTVIEQRLEIETIDIARLRYPKDHPVMDFQSMPFVAIQHEDLRKDLIDMGFDKDVVNELPVRSDGETGQGAIDSKLMAEDRSFEQAPTPELDRITWYEVWLQVPDKGGSTSLERIATADRKELDSTPATFIPLAIGSAFPQGHRVQGLSLVSRLIPIQQSKTEALRQFEDNTESNNNPRATLFNINMDDAMNGRVNGLIRGVEANYRYEPIPVQDLTGGSLAMLGYLDKMRGEAGGAALDMQGTESQLLTSQVGAVASQEILQNQEQISAYIAQNIGQTLIVQLWKTIHRVLREDFTGQLLVRRADQTEQINPSQWPERKRVILNSGMTPQMRNRRATNLQGVIQTQMGMLQAGVPIVDPDGLHAAIRDHGLSVDLPVNSYYIDPQSQKGQQLAQGRAQQAQQQQQQAAQLTQMEQTLKQAEIKMDKYKADLDSSTDIKVALIRAEVDEAKMTIEAIQNAQQTGSDNTARADNGSGSAAAA